MVLAKCREVQNNSFLIEYVENNFTGRQEENMNGCAQSEILEQLGLEMFLTEVNLLLVLYKNGVKDEIKKKKNFLLMAQQYLNRAVLGFSNDQEAKKTGKHALNEETITADTAYRELLIAVKNQDDFQKGLSGHINTLKELANDKDVPSQQIDKTTSLFKSITDRIRENHNEYLEASVRSIAGHQGTLK